MPTTPFSPGDQVREDNNPRSVTLTVKECTTTPDLSAWPVNLGFRPHLSAGEYVCTFERLPSGVQIPPLQARRLVKA